MLGRTTVYIYKLNSKIKPVMLCSLVPHQVKHLTQRTINLISFKMKMKMMRPGSSSLLLNICSLRCQTSWVQFSIFLQHTVSSMWLIITKQKMSYSFYRVNLPCTYGNRSATSMAHTSGIVRYMKHDEDNENMEQ